jgi:UDP-GlcNAc:undecaprenyl-phosphate GlcNAc-1-phosphate transferase
LGFLHKGQKKIIGAVKIVTLLITAIALFMIAFISSAILTAIVRKLSTKRAFLSHPVEDRYHKASVPLGGGSAIFVTMTAAILAGLVSAKIYLTDGFPDLFGPAADEYATNFLNKTTELLVIILSITVLFAVGLWDDKKHLSPFFKLAVQFIVAFMAAALADIRVEFFIESRIVTSVLSAFWIVLIINAFNFLDNMDGLSAGIAAIATCILLTAAIISEQVFVSGLALVFIGTLLGFLVFNFPPARIFMGDAGSLVIGFFVAMLTLRTTYYNQAQSGQWYPVLFPLIVMAVPLYDFLSVTFLRIKQGKSPFVGDTQHFSHRLKRRGLSDTQTTLTLYLATLTTGLSAIFLYQVNAAGAVLIFVQTFMVLAIIAILEAAGKNG